MWRACMTEKLGMRHSGKLFRRDVLRDQAHRSASKVEGGTCPTDFGTTHGMTGWPMQALQVVRQQ